MPNKTRGEVCFAKGAPGSVTRVHDHHNKGVCRCGGLKLAIIHKDRNWTLVEYEGEEVVTHGWVFTRFFSNSKK